MELHFPQMPESRRKRLPSSTIGRTAEKLRASRVNKAVELAEGAVEETLVYYACPE